MTETKDRLVVKPEEDGTWLVAREPESGDGDRVVLEDGIEDRGAAIKYARAEREKDPTSIMLLRVDGSDYGELDHAPPTASAPAQHVELEPAGEEGTAD